MPRGFTVCRLMGIPVVIDVTWPPVFLFVAWFLASSFLPRWLPHRPSSFYWVSSLFVSILLFASVLAHEVGHAIVARRHGLTVYRLGLGLLGGLVEVDLEDGKPADEFFMALAGPTVSLFLGAVFAGGWFILGRGHDLIGNVVVYLALSNVFLGLFNLLPGFPLDGGRMLRASLWYLLGSRPRATIWAERLGQAMGLVCLALAVAWGLSGNLFGGVWVGLVGAFLVGAARSVWEFAAAPED